MLAQFCRQKHSERLKNCDGFLLETHEYFFERSGKIFESIYDFLTIGHLHRSSDICRERLFKELDFWKINKDFFAPCCMSMLYSESEEDDDEYKEKISTIIHGQLICILSEASSVYVQKCDQFSNARYPKLRRKLLLLMEDPNSSIFAKIFALISIGMVIASVTGMILSSSPEFHALASNGSVDSQNHKNDFKPHPALYHVELICILWFTFEYLVRFLVCTNKAKFILQPLNVIDSLTIIPFYAEIILNITGHVGHAIGDFRGLAMMARVVRVMRVARIFRLARYSSGLKSFGVTVKTSLPELSMLILFLLTAVIFFSTLMYFAERDEPNTKFKCIVTMTTVGYGDYCPETLFGKLVASCASISGVLVLAFPITMIVENFSRNYDCHNDVRNSQRKRRMARVYP